MFVKTWDRRGVGRPVKTSLPGMGRRAVQSEIEQLIATRQCGIQLRKISGSGGAQVSKPESLILGHRSCPLGSLPDQYCAQHETQSPTAEIRSVSAFNSGGGAAGCDSMSQVQRFADIITVWKSSSLTAPTNCSGTTSPCLHSGMRTAWTSALFAESSGRCGA